MNLRDAEVALPVRLKTAKQTGCMQFRDSIRPVLDKDRNVDVIIFGSPVYFGYPTLVQRDFIFL